MMETQTAIILFFVLAIMALAIVAFKYNKGFGDVIDLVVEPQDSTVDYKKLYLEEAALNGEYYYPTSLKEIRERVEYK